MHSVLSVFVHRFIVKFTTFSFIVHLKVLFLLVSSRFHLSTDWNWFFFSLRVSVKYLHSLTKYATHNFSTFCCALALYPNEFVESACATFECWVSRNGERTILSDSLVCACFFLVTLCDRDFVLSMNFAIFFRSEFQLYCHCVLLSNSKAWKKENTRIHYSFSLTFVNIFQLICINKVAVVMQLEHCL